MIASARAAERTSTAMETQATRVAKAEAGKQADAHVKSTEKWMATRQRIMNSSAAMAGRIAAKEVADDKRAADAKVAVADRAEKARTASAERESKKREGIEARESRAAERELNKRQGDWDRAVKRTKKERQARVVEQVDGAKRGVSTGVGFGKDMALRAASFSADVAVDIARGAGVNTDLASHFAANSQLHSTATDVSNSSYIAGDKRNGVRQSPDDLVREARKVGTATAYDPAEVLGGLQKYAKTTGDLATARDILKDLAVLSKATGTNLEDMVDAAAQVSTQFEDMPGKGEAVVRVMKVIAGQGKLSAVEVSDLAKQMPKIAAAASKFEGGPEKNIAILGAFAQEARQRGGAASATQAATSVQGFANTFDKGARFEAFKKIGIDVNSTREKGKIRDMRDLVVEALQKTGGNTQSMNKLFADVSAKRTVGGFTALFNDTKNKTVGTEDEKLAAGTKAVREEMERLYSASLGEGEIRDSFNAAMSTSASKAQIFNNKVGQLAEDLQTQALPQLEKLGPVILPLIPALGALLVPTIKLAAAIAKITTTVLGGDAATDNADEADAVDQAEEARANIAKGAAKGEIKKEDIDALGAAKKKLEANLKKRKATAAGETGTTFDDFGDAAFNPMAWIGMADHGDKGARKNTAKLNEQNAQLDLDHVNKTLLSIDHHLKTGTLRMAGATPGPKAPDGPDVKKPMASK